MRSFLFLNKCLPVIEAIDKGIDPASRPISKTLDCNEGNRFQACFDRILKAVIAILSCLALHSTPEELNVAQIAVGLRVEDALMTTCSNFNLK